MVVGGGGRHGFSQNDGGRKQQQPGSKGQVNSYYSVATTWEGAVVGSSYIAEGVSPMARRVDVAGCGRPVSLQRRGVGDDGGLARVARAHPHGSH